MAELAVAAQERRPVPLEGTPSATLLTIAQLAIEDGLLKDLSWLSRPAAATALHQLAVALPTSPEQALLLSRAFEMTREGDAATFIAFATSLALGTRESLDTEWMRPRVALCLALPLGMDPGVDSLAMALVCREDLAVQWLSRPSIGSLPSRRMAAMLIERAAREASRRFDQGDDGAARAFANAYVRSAWQRLLWDRESLVWRHIASARGLLARAIPELASEIAADLDLELTPTQWRRAVASVAATIAVTPKHALVQARSLVTGDLFKRDRGLAGTMMLGLTRAFETEPEAAETLLSLLVNIGGLETIDALAELTRDINAARESASVERARGWLRSALAEPTESLDIGRRAILEARLNELSETTTLATESRDAGACIRRGLHAFFRFGPAAALAAATEGLTQAEHALHVVRSSSDQANDSAVSLQALHALDTWVLQSSALSDLLGLDDGTDQHSTQQRLRELHRGMGEHLYRRERSAPNPPETATNTARMRRLTTWLHLLDAEDHADSTTAAVSALLSRCVDESERNFNRVLCAALSRGCDSLVRTGVLEISDVVLLVAQSINSTRNLEIIAEASMVPELATALNATRSLKVHTDTANGDSISRRRCLDALKSLVDALPTARSPRVEALRLGLLTLYRALESIASAKSLDDLRRDAAAVIGLESALQTVARLHAGALSRVHGNDSETETETETEPRSTHAIRAFVVALETLKPGSDGSGLRPILQELAPTLTILLPPPIADLVLRVLRATARLQPQVQVDNVVSIPPPPFVNSLPGWLPPNRVLGGFYIQQSLGDGAGGSVFVVTRADERHRPNAKRYALKVPMYDGTVARTLSESEFLALFRQEAGALLSLPDNHPNLAKFVTFDAGATPKPLLVMELVEGPSLARLLHRGRLPFATAMRTLDGVAAGLCAMHALGLGHLDVKPANVIMRDHGADVAEPVLVDFGLSGRNLRPGCGTGNYGAPEIWGLLPAGCEALAPAADVYAFSCLAFELITGNELFSGPSDMALITAHITQDGWPPPLAALSDDPKLMPFASLLSKGLRQDPRARASMSALRSELAALRL